MAQLVILDPSGGEQRIRLERPEYILGRDPSVSIQLQDPKVSRKHARIVHDGAAYWIEDLGSANGVLIDGRPITQPRRMQGGIEVDVGGFLVVLQEEAVGAAAGGSGFCLLGMTAPYENQTFMLPQGQLDIGRVEGTAIVVPDVSVSRRHATLTVGPQSVIVEDLDSSNGTFVNNVKVGRREVKPGNRIRFGNVEFEFALAGAAAPAGAAIGLFSRLARADRSIQIALGIAALAFLLLVITIVVAARRGTPSRAGGKGPAQSLEEAYYRAIETSIQTGREHMANEAWDEATRAFQEVLDKDPIHREARRGLAAARANEADKKTIATAEAALQNKQPAEVLGRLRSVRSDAHYARAAHTVAERARDLLANASLAAARTSCKKSEWKPCHQHATTVLEHRPDNTEGRAFVSEAENAMRARRIPFTPWTRPATPTTAGGKPGGTLQSMYTDGKVRDAAARYAAGDLETAIQWARTYTSRAGASKLSQGLVAFRRAKTAGDGAAIAGDVDRAVKQWEEALTADASILPAGHPSVLRDQVRRRMGLELFRKGDAAFDRAVYAEAFRYWNLGLRHNPEDPELLGGVERLEKRAMAALEDVPTGKTLGADDCNRLSEILAMSRPSSDVHGSAKRRKQKYCKR